MDIDKFIDNVDPWDPELIRSYIQVLKDWK